MVAGHLNLETLKSSLLFNFRTGNVAIDTLITGLIICISTYLINLASKIQNVDYRALFDKWFGKIKEPEPLKNIINVSGKEDNDGYRSDTFLALIFRIKKLNCATSEISQLSEIRVDDDTNSYDYDEGDDEEVNELLEKANKKGANLIVSQPTPFIIGEDVQAIVNHHSDKKDNEEKDIKKRDIDKRSQKVRPKSRKASKIGCQMEPQGLEIGPKMGVACLVSTYPVRCLQIRQSTQETIQNKLNT